MEQAVLEALGILASAALLALIASGLALSFGLMRIINLAHGEFLMLGAYAATITAGHGHPWPGLAVAAVVAGAVGAGVEVTMIRRLYGSPELSILATFGLSLVLRQLVEMRFGKDYQASRNPIPGASTILGVTFPTYRLVLIAIAVAVLSGMLAVLYLTPVGARVRAVASDRMLAEAVGIRANRLSMFVFTGSAALAGLAGALVAPITTVEPGMGLNYLFDAFLVIIVAGSRISRVLAASFAIAAVGNVTTYYSDSVTAKLAVLALAFSVLLARRSGRPWNTSAAAAPA